MTRAVLEAENECEARKTTASIPPSKLAVPASLHASLMARLDRLGPAKEVAQIGAVIGREFSYPLLSAVVGKPEEELQSALERLINQPLSVSLKQAWCFDRVCRHTQAISLSTPSYEMPLTGRYCESRDEFFTAVPRHSAFGGRWWTCVARWFVKCDRSSPGVSHVGNRFSEPVAVTCSRLLRAVSTMTSGYQRPKPAAPRPKYR
jgi:hypothetical protein